MERYVLLVGFAVFGIFAFIGLQKVTDSAESAHQAADHAAQIAHDNAQAINDIEVERRSRTRAVSGVIFLGCSRDNKQDLLLGTLLAGSLKASQGRDLGVRQRKIVKQYRHKLHDLLQVPECSDVVRAFLRASGAGVRTGASPLQPPPIQQKMPKASP